MTNKETLELCLSLGIGVKTHSSGIEEAQADRVRRRAARDGLIREQQPAPASKSKAAEAAAPAASSRTEAPARPKKAPAGEAQPEREPGAAPSRPAPPRPGTPTQRPEGTTPPPPPAGASRPVRPAGPAAAASRHRSSGYDDAAGPAVPSRVLVRWRAATAPAPARRG